MASAGTVTLNLDANSVKLIRELQKAERSTKNSASNMSDDFSRMASNIAKTTAVVATAFAVMATKLTRDGLKVIDANAKMARSLNASNDALQALRMAAGDTGLEGLDSSLNKMNRALGAAEMGTGRAVKTIEALGLNLQTIGMAIRDAGISSEQASRHLQNLGFEQSQAMAFFSSGISDLSTYRREIQALGLSLSSFDAARVERANDAMGVFGDVVQGISQRVAVNMSDIIYYFSESFNKMAVQSGNLGTIIDDLFEKILMGSINVFEAVATTMSPIVSITKSLWDSFAQLPQFAKELGIIGALFFGIQGRFAIAAFIAAMGPISRFIQKSASDLAGVEGAAGSQLQRLASTLSGESDFSLLGSAAGLFTPDYENNVSAQASRLRQIMNEMIADREALRASMSQDPMWNDPNIDDWLDRPDIETDEEKREREMVEAERLKTLRNYLDAMSQTETQMSQFAKQAANNMQTSFANFLFDPFKEGLRGMLSGLIDTLRRMVAEIAAQKVLSVIFGSLANASNPVMAALGTAFGGSAFVGPMPSRDSGGRGSAGQPYLIGKGAQPEMFIPDSAGTFIPNADKMGGTSFSISIDARDPGAEGRIKAMIEQEMVPQIIEAAKGNTIASLRRPRFA